MQDFDRTVGQGLGDVGQETHVPDVEVFGVVEVDMGMAKPVDDEAAPARPGVGLGEVIGDDAHAVVLGVVVARRRNCHSEHGREEHHRDLGSVGAGDSAAPIHDDPAEHEQESDTDENRTHRQKGDEDESASERADERAEGAGARQRADHRAGLLE